MTWGCRRVPPPPQFYYTEVYHAGSGDLSDGFGRLSISPCTTRYSQSHSVVQRPDGLFQQWMSGDASSKAVMRQLGYGSEGDDEGQRRPSPPQRKPSSLPASASRGKGDAPLVDLHIHITDNNIGSLSFGQPTPN